MFEDGQNMAVHPALLLRRSDYNVSWKNADPNYPVRVQWCFDTGDSYTVICPWEKSELFYPGLTLQGMELL